MNWILSDFDQDKNGQNKNIQPFDASESTLSKYKQLLWGWRAVYVHVCVLFIGSGHVHMIIMRAEINKWMELNWIRTLTMVSWPKLHINEISKWHHEQYLNDWQYYQENRWDAASSVLDQNSPFGLLFD